MNFDTFYKSLNEVQKISWIEEAFEFMHENSNITLKDSLIKNNLVSSKEIESVINNTSNDIELANSIHNNHSSNIYLNSQILPLLSAINGRAYIKKINVPSMEIPSEIINISGLSDECKKYKCIVSSCFGYYFLLFGKYSDSLSFESAGISDILNSPLFLFLKDKEYIIAYTSEENIAIEHDKFSNDEIEVSSSIELNTRTLINSSEEYLKRLGEILQECVNQGASDLHITPSLSDEEVYTELRVKTALKSIGKQFRIDHKTYCNIRDYLTRITESTKDGSPVYVPTDGKTVTVITSNKTVRIRTSLIPLGEMKNTESNPVRVVIRFIDFETDVKSLSELGIDDVELTHIKNALDMKGSMAIFVGPVGVGKSTTLYACLKEYKKNNPHRSVGSIEDPIEQLLDGVHQVQISDQAKMKNMGFVDYLKVFLRQDFNCLCIGEMRDRETVAAANQFASVGSTILTTLHGHDEIDGLQRALSMLDSKDQRFMFLSNISYIFSQRIIPVLCPHCKIEVTDNKINKDTIQRWLNRSNTEDVDEVLPNFEEVTQYKKNKAGCKECNQTGIHSLKAVVGVLEFTPEVIEVLLSSSERKFLDVRKLRKSSFHNQIAKMILNGYCEISELNQ